MFLELLGGACLESEVAPQGSHTMRTGLDQHGVIRDAGKFEEERGVIFSDMASC